MSFSLEDSGVAVAQLLRRAAVLLHAIVSWVLSSSFSDLLPSSSGTHRPSSVRAIKERLQISTYAERHRRSDDETCAVCLMEMCPRDEVPELHNCRHVFHRSCLDRWLDHDDLGTCPLCRAPLVCPPPPEPPAGPSWEVERLLYLFGDDLLLSAPSSSSL